MKAHKCKGNGCELIIPKSWGDFCSCCFYEGMNPSEFEKAMKEKVLQIETDEAPNDQAVRRAEGGV